MNSKRLRALKTADRKKGPVVYWMSREQRTRDNWALLWAQELSRQEEVPLVVVFCLSPQFLGATLRQYHSLLHGLAEVAQRLHTFNIPFHLLVGSPEKELVKFLKDLKVGCLVTDFDPLRLK